MKDFPLKWIEIDLDVVRANLRWIQSRLNPGASLMAVVKADAYGHGAVEISRLAAQCGATTLGVLTVSEGARLRQAGIKTPIQVLAPILPQQARETVGLRLTPTIDSLDQARALNALGRKVLVHVDLDFGLGRWGIAPKNTASFFEAVKRLTRIEIAGLSTHIDYVPGKNSVEAEEKLTDFNRIAKRLKRDYPALVCHAANSSVFLDFPHWQLDMVRVGNLIYGIKPSPSHPARVANPWSFKARIISLHRVKKGESIGYASEYIAPKSMILATAAVGYADGLTMEPAERLIKFGSGFEYWAMISGRKAPFIGRCGIVHVLLDVSRVSGVNIGDTVRLPLRRTAANSHLPRIYTGSRR
jgi:alanine racemase